MNIGQRRKEVAKLTEEGRSLSAIAGLVGTSVNTVRSDRKAMGVTASKGRTRVPIETQRQIDERLLAGASYQTIQKEFNISPFYIYMRRKSLGLPIRHRSDRTELAQRRALIPSMVAEGQTAEEIARTLKVKRETVEADKRAMGAQKRNFMQPIELAKADIDAWVAEGKSLGELAAHKGVTITRLRSALSKIGWDWPQPSAPIPERFRGLMPSSVGPVALQALIDQGHSLSQISRHLGVSRQGISDYCRRNKLKLGASQKGRGAR